MGKIPLFTIRASQASKILGDKGLGETGKNYCIDWLKAHLYGFRKEFSSKYTEKGNICEDAGIDLVSRVLYGGRLLIKNTVRKYNDFAEGECDIEMKNSIEDIKNSWDAYTFPLFKEKCPNKDYEEQGNTYLWLYDKEVFNLHYCLNDAPPDMIEAEYWKAHWNMYKKEREEVDDNLFEEVRSKMVYSHLPDHLRLKTYTFKRNEPMIKKLENRVLECRDFIESLK